VEDINVDDVEFGEDRNAVFVDTICEYYFDYSAVGGFGWAVTKLDQV
jgi:hypothetical protein